MQTVKTCDTVLLPGTSARCDTRTVPQDRSGPPLFLIISSPFH